MENRINFKLVAITFLIISTMVIVVGLTRFGLRFYWCERRGNVSYCEYGVSYKLKETTAEYSSIEIKKMNSCTSPFSCWCNNETYCYKGFVVKKNVESVYMPTPGAAK